MHRNARPGVGRSRRGSDLPWTRPGFSQESRMPPIKKTTAKKTAAKQTTAKKASARKATANKPGGSIPPPSNVAPDGARSPNRSAPTSAEPRDFPAKPAKKVPAAAVARAELARAAGLRQAPAEGAPTKAATALSWAQSGDRLTTAQGLRVDDADNSLTAGERGPTLLEDFHLRERIMHFDHERIPERVVHARGAGAHGVFEATAGLETSARRRSCGRGRPHRSSCASRPWPGHGAPPTPPAMFVASRRSSTPRRATSIWSATTSRCSSSRTG